LVDIDPDAEARQQEHQQLLAQNPVGSSDVERKQTNRLISKGHASIEL
jgi:hypothetical protein